jgi:hypothetical protein
MKLTRKRNNYYKILVKKLTLYSDLLLTIFLEHMKSLKNMFHLKKIAKFFRTQNLISRKAKKIIHIGMLKNQ